MSLKLYGKFTRIHLGAEVAPSVRDEFVLRYQSITGESPVGDASFMSQDNKWGAELRMYFDAEAWVVESLRKLGYTVEERAGQYYRGEYQFRINSQDLFWRLVEHGYRLGANAPIS